MKTEKLLRRNNFSAFCIFLYDDFWFSFLEIGTQR